MVSNKRIALNTIYLYIRMILVMGMQLITVRFVLKALGVEEYGIYNLVGGIVVMFAFLNTTMRAATQRFLNFEMGQQQPARLKGVFSTSLYLHCIIVVVLLFFAETIGLWLVNYKLIIPAHLLIEANIVYQLSIAAALVSILQVPFNAVIIAHERMKVFAVSEVLRTLLVLVGVLLLMALPFDRLIFYAVLVFLSSFLLFVFYVLYSLKKFEEVSLVFKPSKAFIKPMLSFSGWDLYGNMCVTFRTQGINIILNLFFGAVVNAAAAIATNIQGSLLTFGGNVLTAFRPQLIQQYAAGNLKEVHLLACNATKLSILLFGIISGPIIIEMPVILKLWLGEIPPYTIGLARISILIGVSGFITSTLNTLIHATGNIKMLSFISGTLILLTLPICWIVLCFLDSPYLVFWVVFGVSLLIPAFSLMIVKHLIRGFLVRQYLYQGFFKVGFVLAVSFAASLLIRTMVDDEFVRLIISTLTYIVVCGILSLWLLLPHYLVRTYLWKIFKRTHSSVF